MKKPVVMQTDFGLGISVSTMHGVCDMVDPNLKVVDSSHDITQFDIYEGSTSLDFVVDFWQPGTVFVSVVDPGVGTARKGAVAKLSNGSYVVTPDNGSLTHVLNRIGVTEVREIDESVHYWPASKDIAIFHGRDVFAYTAAKLASNQITFEEVGEAYPVSEIITFDLVEPEYKKGYARGMIAWNDEHFGLVSSNLDYKTFIEETGYDINDLVNVKITHNDKTMYEDEVKIVRAFGDVAKGEPLLFNGETNTLEIAVNFTNISKTYGIKAGPDWIIEISK